MTTPPHTVRTVAEVMSSPVVTALPDETVAAAAARMSERGVGSVIVVDGNRPIGILTERDVVRLAAAGPASAATKVVEWMTAEPDCIAPGLSVQEAFASLSEHGYRHIPVVEGDDLVGIVSLRDLMRVAQIQPVVHPGQIEAPPGLEGVIVAETQVGDVRGLEGFYHYRQYSAVELAARRSLEDVWHLLFEGHLPSAEESRAFAAEVRARRRPPEDVWRLLPDVAAAGGPLMDQLRTAVSLIGHSQGFRPWLDIPAGELRANAIQVCAAVPTLIMALHRVGRGESPVDPDPDLGYGADYLWMLTGERPDAARARAVEQYQMLTIDHGFNASTFTARVITSTGADLAGAVTGGIAALSGPLHGGAPSRALDLLDAIGTPDNARPYLVDAVTRGEKIMGFGHRVYKTDDPRSLFLRDVAERIGAEKVEFAKQVERTVVDVLAELKPGRNLYANVEFYAGVVMEHAGLPPDLFSPTFASSRVIGWCANILEQAADNRIIRPSARYVGPPPPQPVPAGSDAAGREG
ncbi:MAG TPA: citrate/2-methylcitrate synthase [Acidimicrobiales bacterium]|nr:citrate/2-methylcitrate synthase [Acidimicrobiales bacterium]